MGERARGSDALTVASRGDITNNEDYIEAYRNNARETVARLDQQTQDNMRRWPNNTGIDTAALADQITQASERRQENERQSQRVVLDEVKNNARIHRAPIEGAVVGGGLMTLLFGLRNQRKAAAGSLPAQGPAEVTELQRLFGGATQAPVQSSLPPTAVAHNSVPIRVVAAVVLGVFGGPGRRVTAEHGEYRRFGFAWCPRLVLPVPACYPPC